MTTKKLGDSVAFFCDNEQAEPFKAVVTAVNEDGTLDLDVENNCEQHFTAQRVPHSADRLICHHWQDE